MATTDVVMEFSDIFLEHLGCLVNGRLKLSDSGGISFKGQKTGKVEHVGREDIGELEWLRLANQPGLKVTKKDLLSFRFGGFKDADQERIRTFAQSNWSLGLDMVDPSVKGWNYGKSKFEGQSMVFKNEGKPVFEVPLSNVNSCSAQKSENEEAPVSLMEMRFHVPVDPDDENALDPVEEFRKAVLKYAGIMEDDGRKPIVTIKELFCNTPRGKYDFDIFHGHLTMRGKTFTYTIHNNTILRMFLLPHKDGIHMFFVISLDPPLRQGQTRYPYLVLEFTKEEEVDVELNMSEEQIKEKYDGKLQREMSGPTYEVFCRVLRTLLKQKITVPGTFVGHSGTPAIGCAYKQANGFLYPLERGFVFVHKPPMYLRFEEITGVNFARSDHSTKSFDFEVETKAGLFYPFSGIEKEEYGKLFDFMGKKNVRIRNAGKSGPAKKTTDGFSDSDEEVDPYKERLKKEAQSREDAAMAEESDSDEEDSDYNPEMEAVTRRRQKEELRAKGDLDSSDDTGSDSEPDLEYDSEAGSTSESGTTESDDSSGDEEDPKPKKKKEPREAKPRKASGGKRKKKDPNAPKKGMSAYFLWLNANRATIKEEGMSITDVSKKAGELWKGMTEDDKKEWEEKSAKDKERYQTEMEEYRKNKPPTPEGDSDDGDEKKPKTKKSNSSPKKSTTTSPKKNVKSKEYISDSDESSSDGGAKKKDAAKAKPAAKAKAKSDESSSEESGGGKPAKAPSPDSDSEPDSDEKPLSSQAKKKKESSSDDSDD